MHLDEETLERVLHDELGTERALGVRDHLSGCFECSSALADARRREARIFTLLGELDAPPGAEKVEPRAAAERPWIRVAAAVALVVAAGGALALPGSPIRAWFEGRQAASEARGRSDTAPADPARPAASGITVEPAGPFRIVFLSPQETGHVRVRLDARPDVEIRVTGDPVVLESAPDRIAVANRGSRASYDVRLPAAGPRVEIRVAERRVLAIAEGRVSTDAPPEDGGWRIDLTPP